MIGTAGVGEGYHAVDDPGRQQAVAGTGARAGDPGQEVAVVLGQRGACRGLRRFRAWRPQVALINDIARHDVRDQHAIDVRIGNAMEIDLDALVFQFQLILDLGDFRGNVLLFEFVGHRPL